MYSLHTQICELLRAPVSTIQSTLLLGERPGEASDPASERLQRMLMESIANGSVASPADIKRLISSTLCYHQVGGWP